jgi:hypothetical protein
MKNKLCIRRAEARGRLRALSMRHTPIFHPGRVWKKMLFQRLPLRRRFSRDAVCIERLGHVYLALILDGLYDVRPC